ncbi:MAG: branched-chain amino acid ABC transporter permease [Firmicutes bacterium]|jgi:branched-chain amino acid transport system permease protein|nr:branched-chain amino acid ABC transporter permease [Bacillota bacterium]
MNEFVQQVLNGLAIGSVYALVAVGYTLVFGVLRFINFAHGSVLTFAAYVSLFSVLVFKVPFPFAFGASLVLSGLFSIMIERQAYRPLRARGAPNLNLLITSIGVSLLVENAIIVFYSADFFVFPRVLPSGTVSLLGLATAPPIDLLLTAVAVFLMSALYMFVNFSKMGVAIQALAHDRDAAALMGININLTIAYTFFIAGVMASSAGVLIGIKFNVNPYLGGLFGVKSFAAAVVGGIGSIPGSYFGGYLIGLLETMGAGYVSSNYKDAIAFVLLVLILLFKPSGLLGRGIQEKV